MVVFFALFFILGFITASNIALVIYNANKYKHSKTVVETAQKSNSEVENSTDKNDNVNIYDLSKMLGADVFDEYMNGGENERGR